MTKTVAKFAFLLFFCYCRGCFMHKGIKYSKNIKQLI
nr:MAG TPA: hypothetical protein [Caudoviricetes sp.]